MDVVLGGVGTRLVVGRLVTLGWVGEPQADTVPVAGLLSRFSLFLPLGLAAKKAWHSTSPYGDCDILSENRSKCALDYRLL